MPSPQCLATHGRFAVGHAQPAVIWQDAQPSVVTFLGDGAGGLVPSSKPPASLAAGQVVLDGFVLDATRDGIPDVVLVTFSG